MQLHVIEQGDLLAAIQSASVAILLGCFLAGLLGHALARLLFYIAGRIIQD